jgi:3-phenylpropionate/trans-cinnamate dioxygenase ferredoxin reductase component
MDLFDYLIVGTGMAADAAVQGIRELDSHGRIALLGDDPNPPYSRPPLSKSLWKGKSIDSIWRRTAQRSVTLLVGCSVSSINIVEKTVQTEKGDEYGYGKLLLATGGSPRRLPFGGEEIIYFRTLEDYHRLREQSGKHKHFGMIGGGFIGSEIAAALAMNGEKVTMLFPEDGIGARVYPREISKFLNSYFREKGVEVLPNTSVKDMIKQGDSYQLITDTGKAIPADVVIAGIGIVPNIDLAKTAGLQVGNGIVVDKQLRTSHPDIYAAGDVAEVFQPLLEKRLRLEHEDNANEMGKQAGRNMAGANETYEHLSYFYSDLFDLGYEAVGELDPRTETFIDWQDPFKKGVIYYLSRGKVMGVLLWNVWGARPAAQALINTPGIFSPADLKSRLV